MSSDNTEPLDPAKIMAEHFNELVDADHYCEKCDRLDWREPCLPYRLAEALASERARVQRVEALALRWEQGVGTSGRASEQLRAAVAGDTERVG